MYKVGDKIELIKDVCGLPKGLKTCIYYVSTAEHNTGGAMVGGTKGNYLIRVKNRNYEVTPEEIRIRK